MTDTKAPSSIGKTSHFECGKVGSTPAGAANTGTLKIVAINLGDLKVMFSDGAEVSILSMHDDEGTETEDVDEVYSIMVPYGGQFYVDYVENFHRPPAN